MSAPASTVEAVLVLLDEVERILRDVRSAARDLIDDDQERNDHDD